MKSLLFKKDAACVRMLKSHYCIAIPCTVTVNTDIVPYVEQTALLRTVCLKWGNLPTFNRNRLTYAEQSAMTRRIHLNLTAFP